MIFASLYPDKEENIKVFLCFSLSFHKTHIVCLFIKEKKDKKKAFLLPLSFHKPHYVCVAAGSHSYNLIEGK
jgi:hypothetical protein